MAKYVIFKTEVPHFKKEGKMERKENGCFGWKWQPVAQATGAYGTGCKIRKKGDYNEKS